MVVVVKAVVVAGVVVVGVGGLVDGVDVGVGVGVVVLVVVEKGSSGRTNSWLNGDKLCFRFYLYGTEVLGGHP